MTELVHRAVSDVDQVQLLLVASADPSVVFASLAAPCVPNLCDDCIIGLVDGTRAVSASRRHDPTAAGP